VARPDYDKSTLGRLVNPFPARKEVNLLLNVIQALVARMKREEGQTVVEYALVLGGVSLVLLAALVGAGLEDEFTDLVANIAEAMGTAL
jgi:Flp pilus assembly pilin Flp